MKDRSKRKVLVVDDEIHILHVVSLKLRNGGYEVVTAQDGREGLDIAQVECPDVIITDYQMPHLSGLEMCQRLKRIASTSEIPAILLTARGFNLDADSMSATGIVTCLHKPFSPRELLERIDELVEAKAVIGPAV